MLANFCLKYIFCQRGEVQFVCIFEYITPLTAAYLLSDFVGFASERNWVTKTKPT